MEVISSHYVHPDLLVEKYLKFSFMADLKVTILQYFFSFLFNFFGLMYSFFELFEWEIK